MSDLSPVPEARIYVANLSYSMTQEDVERLFTEVGTVVDVFLPKPKEAKHHKGYGFVEMSTAREAQDAIDEFHGEEDYFGRVLTVRIADRDKK
jgi:RNA recognition motif-containing protein